MTHTASTGGVAAPPQRRGAAIKLYGMASPNVVKVMIMLEEAQLPYELIWVNLWKDEHYSDHFLSLNPNSKVPALIDERRDPPISVFESGAILIYLAEQQNILLPQNEPERSQVISWLMLQMSGVGPNFGQHAHFAQSAPEPIPYAQRRYTGESLRLLKVLNYRLSAAPFLAGDYSIADISVLPWVRMGPMLGLPIDDFPHVVRWLDDVAARPAVARALSLWDTMLVRARELREQATPEQKERYYGRLPR